MHMSELGGIGDRLLVVFDGYCGLCERSVRWLLARDRLDRMRFVPFDSAKVAGLLARQGISGTGSASGPGTILVVRDPDGPAECVLTRSEAVLALLRELPQPWPAVAAALGWIPGFVRDPAYRLVARWRYRIWGRRESCAVPAGAERGRFL